MNATKIEWVLNPDGTQGYTCSDKTGCLNHVGGMCKGGDFPCYAYRLANGRLRRLMMDNLLDNDYVLNMREAMCDPFYPRFWPERLEQIRKRKKPTGIFLNDMSDWMGSYWPKEWTEAELQVMRDCPQHRFYTLTKQPQNLTKSVPFPDNCWVGVTATDAKMAGKAFACLEGVEARVKYLSLEPLLGRANLNNSFGRALLSHVGVKWVIIGAQTKPYKPPKIEWVREIVEACDKAGVKVFLKDNLRPLIVEHWNNRDVTAIMINHSSTLNNKVVALRQELPE